MKRMKLVPEEVTRIIVTATMNLPDEDPISELLIEHCEGFVEDLGCHYILMRNGTVHKPVADDERGNWFARFSPISVVVVIEGGLNSKGNPENNYSHQQLKSLKKVVVELQDKYPVAEVTMHREIFYGANPVITKEEILDEN